MKAAGFLLRLSAPLVPNDLRRAKGWVGALIEKTLGASAGSRAGPSTPAG